MKTILITCTALAFSGFASGQCCPYMGSVTVDPAAPAATDNIRIFTVVTTPNWGSLIEHSFTVQNDTIFAEACYWEGAATALRTIEDTIEVGQLPQGDYTVQFTANQSSMTEQCVVTGSQVAYTAFSVGDETTGIEVPVFSAVKLYPNPVDNAFTLEGENMSAVRLLNLEGKSVGAAPMWQSENKLTVETGTLPAGFYVVELEQNGTLQRLPLVKK